MSKINNDFMPMSKKRKTEKAEMVECACEEDHQNNTEDHCCQKEADSDCDGPQCWTLLQKNDFCERNEWLYVKNKMLGCKVCRDVGSVAIEKQKVMKISVEWANGKISHFGESRKQQLMSLRKKIYEHKESAAHKACQKIKSEAKNETIKFEAKNKTLEKVFRIAYKLAKKNQPFNDFEDEIKLQELNGLDMGHAFHSANDCINMVSHIANEMRKTLIDNIVNSKNKILLLIDELTTVGNTTTLMVIVHVVLPDLSAPLSIFLDLIELSDITAGGILNSFLSQLECLGLSEDYLKKYLLSVTSDGAAVVFGVRTVVTRLMQDMFPGVVFWHCANHRLELYVGDTVSDVAEMNRFKSFMDKLYVTYNASPNNARELQECAPTLEQQLLKIGRILSTRWVASTFGAISAVWKDFEALVHHFQEAKEDSRRSKMDHFIYESLLRKITSCQFVLDLGLMYDALQELSKLRLELQEINIDLYRAHRRIKDTVKLLEERTENPGPYYNIALQSQKNMKFKGIELQKNEKHCPAINASAFYKSLKEAIGKCLLEGDDAELPECVKILDSKNWPENPGKRQTFGEAEIGKLAHKFGLNEKEAVSGFHEYLRENKVPDVLLHLKRSLNTIATSSSEYERCFSEMNLIVTTSPSQLLKTTSALMFIRLIGPPLHQFNPRKYVDSWLLRGHHSAADTSSKKRAGDGVDISEDIFKVWKLL